MPRQERGVLKVCSESHQIRRNRIKTLAAFASIGLQKHGFLLRVYTISGEEKRG